MSTHLNARGFLIDGVLEIKQLTLSFLSFVEKWEIWIGTLKITV
ncbi:MAG: hypothetical protein P8009_03130 [Gammaproteobacteria bacterium]